MWDGAGGGTAGWEMCESLERLLLLVDGALQSTAAAQAAHWLGSELLPLFELSQAAAAVVVVEVADTGWRPPPPAAT